MNDFSIGMRVVRGPDWKWGDQDKYNGQPGEGLITAVGSDGDDNWATVCWDDGEERYSYRVGAEDGKFDLALAKC